MVVTLLDIFKGLKLPELSRVVVGFTPIVFDICVFEAKLCLLIAVNNCRHLKNMITHFVD